jgi:hypothetical protein
MSSDTSAERGGIVPVEGADGGGRAAWRKMTPWVEFTTKALGLNSKAKRARQTMKSVEDSQSATFNLHDGLQG